MTLVLLCRNYHCKSHLPYLPVYAYYFVPAYIYRGIYMFLRAYFYVVNLLINMCVDAFCERIY